MGVHDDESIGGVKCIYELTYYYGVHCLVDVVVVVTILIAATMTLNLKSYDQDCSKSHVHVLVYSYVMTMDGWMMPMPWNVLNLR